MADRETERIVNCTAVNPRSKHLLCVTVNKRSTADHPQLFFFVANIKQDKKFNLVSKQSKACSPFLHQNYSIPHVKSKNSTSRLFSEKLNVGWPNEGTFNLPA